MRTRGPLFGRPGTKRLIVVALMSLVGLGLIPVAAAATRATVKGTFAGPGLPDAGEGVVGVRAIDVRTGVVDDADYTGGRRDRWRLSVAPGPHVLGAAAVPFAGGKVVDRLVAFSRARAGKTDKLKLSLKRKRRRGNAGRAQAVRPAHALVADGFGDVSVDYPAISVEEFEVPSPDPELGVLRKGMVGLTMHELISGFQGTPGCVAVVVERGRIDDLVNERKLQELPYFDRDTRIPQGHLIKDNASVTGTVDQVDSQLTMSATYTDHRSGRTETVAVQGPRERVFDVAGELGTRLVDAICNEDPPAPVGLPDSYAGSISGSSVDSEMTRTWSGTVAFHRVDPPGQGAVPCVGASVACYEIVGGAVTWRTSTTPGAFCMYNSAPRTVTIDPGAGSLVVEATGSGSPGYAGGLTIADETTGTLQCGSDPPVAVPYYPFDCCWATGAGSPWGEFAEAGGLRLRGTSITGGAGGFGITYNWDLTGQ